MSNITHMVTILHHNTVNFSKYFITS